MGKYKYLYLGAIAVVIFLVVIIKINNASVDKSSDKQGIEITGLDTASTNLYLFWGDGCPHCAKEEVFLKSIESKYPDLRIQRFEVWNHKDNASLMMAVAKQLNTSIGGVPFTIIGDKTFVGFDESYIASQIEDRIKECVGGSCPDSVASIVPALESKKDEAQTQAADEVNQTPKVVGKIDAGIFGELDMAKLSLPALTVIIGILDGFNPCAMWTLIFLISLLIGMHNKKRMWILGSAFIVASAAVYFLFMVAWLNIFLFIGMVAWVKVIIGLVALLGAWYSLKDFYTNKDAACEVGDVEKKKKTMNKLQTYVENKSFWLAFFGIVALAFMVNLIELLCSAGFPAVYTQVLAMNNLPTWQYYSYILIYIFFFMLDDLIVFFVAMFTLQTTGLTTKYSRASRLVGGVLMLIIGLLMIFKPSVLTNFSV